MLWKRTYMKKVAHRYHCTRTPRVRRMANDDQKNLLLNPLEVDFGGTIVSRKRKVGHFSTEPREGRVRKKRKEKGNSGVDDMDAGIDRISELPEQIVHLIFAHLRCAKDVVRTSILSKTWKSMFESYLVFDFDERYFGVRGAKGRHNRIKAREVQKKRFNQYVEKSLGSRLGSVPCIEKFRLCVRTLDEVRWTYMDQWLHTVVKKNVKELEIQVATKRNYFAPDFVLSSSSITSLKLSACLIMYDMNLCHLRILSLKETHVTEHMIRRVAKSCPLIEDLRLVHCTIFRLSISNLLKLRRVEVHDCKSLLYIKIDAPNLETFWYHAKRKQQCKIHLEGCGNLKYLVLKDRRLSNSMFLDLLSKCPSLETLVLQECRYLQRLTILSRKLKSLALIHCERLQEIIIDAPNLYSFQFSGSSGDKLPFFSMNVSSLHEAKFSFGNKEISNFFAENKEFFRNFDESKGFKLITYSQKDMKIYEEPSDAYLLGGSFDKVELIASSTGILRIIDKWLRECHGHSLTLIYPSSGLWELICTMIKNREENPECCRFYSNKCWRHYLASVKILNSSIEFEWKSRSLKK